MISLGFGLACIGFILLSLSLKRHFRQVWPHSQTFKQWLLLNRVAGYSCTLVAIVPCILARGLWIGMVLWLSILAAAAFLQAMLLSYYPQRSVLFAGVSLVLVAVGLLS